MFLSSRLIENEGVWLHTKLLAGNLAQIVITTALAIVFVIIGNLVAEIVLAEAEDGAFSAALFQNPNCDSSFDIENCYFPQSNDTSTGIALCSGIFLPNSTCSDDLVTASGGTYEEFCKIFQDAVDELPAPASFYFAENECPSLTMPFPNVMSSFAEGSSEEAYCASPLSACTIPYDTGDGLYFDICMLGFSYKNPFPFQFEGELCSNFTQMDLLLEKKAENAAIAAQYWPPKKWMFDLSTAVGIACVFLVGVSTISSTIPSMIITTLKFRSGEIASLRDPYFKKYRQDLLKTSFLLGAAIWGSIISSGIVFCVAYLIAFLLSFEVTRSYILSFVSLLIGITVTLIVKIIVSKFLTKYSFVGFYRKRPLVANIASLCFECWHLALTSSYIILRVVKLFFIIIVYVGRFDTPMLARGVGEIGAVKLDAFPFIFKQDLLAIDAHRHPYIERLGMMYMMKLKHGDKFAKKTGSIWRLLFVYALFPWLRQYRILNNENDELQDGDNLELFELDGDGDGVETPLCKNPIATDVEVNMSLFRVEIAALNNKIKRLKEVNKNLKHRR
mmetsp:Transcript_1545/g.1898  ORF Transcript_1545/g.1898 Transcript_1545/m.1898 type:complete len:560 (+) Transcript_1545:1461-3140(+)